MKTEFGETPEKKCLSCGEQGPHEVTYTADPIHHLRCKACRAVNAYVFEDPEAVTKGGRWQGAVLQDHAALMKLRGSRPLSPYAISNPYSDGKYIQHGTLGAGYVLSLLGPKKMEVLFADKKRVLACGPGSTTGSQRAQDRRREQQGRSGTPSRPAKPARSSTRGRPRRDEPSKGPSGDKPVKCPVCGRLNHPFNLMRNVQGRIVGCMYCS